MHAGWSFVVVFFAFLFSPWTLLVTLPWTASLLLGGLYYGQHYAVDYLMALPITAFAIFLSFFLVNLEAKQRKKKAGKADTEQPTETPIR